MGQTRHTVLWIFCIVMLLGAAGCSKKKPAGEEAAKSKTLSESIANQAPAPAPLTPATAPYAPAITAKGYQVVQAKRFPAQVDARRAAVVVYRTTDGTRGGILYVRGFENDPPRPVWHWYFDNAAPDSVTAVDLNRDGLWDVRAYMSGGKTLEFTQDSDFSFGGAEHEGLAANNGASSKSEGLWKVFDADTSTFWQSPAAGAYIDIPNPFGLEVGQLTVRQAGGLRATRLEIGDGTRKIQECELDANSGEQRFQLDPAVKGVATIRIGVVGKGKNVALSELEIR
jgi:hypothetical protein